MKLPLALETAFQDTLIPSRFASERGDDDESRLNRARITFLLGIIEGHLWQMLITWLQNGRHEKFPFVQIVEACKNFGLILDPIVNEYTRTHSPGEGVCQKTWSRVLCQLKELSQETEYRRLLLLAAFVSALSCYFRNSDWSVDVLKVWAGYKPRVVIELKSFGLEDDRHYSLEEFTNHIDVHGTGY